MSDFVHLHVHTEYSMLDGAAKNKKLFAEAERQGAPAIAMSDHGNMFGAYEFFQTAKKGPVKPIIGIEAYVAPESRHHKRKVFWGKGGQRGATADGGEGGKDVSGGGQYTHMTMWAKNAQGLRNLFRLSSVASYEGFFGKPRMDMELISQHAEGIIGTTGCPSGAVQTRLRLGQWDEAVKVAAAYQDMLGKENYFLELMDHGIDIEHEVRADLLKLAKHLDIPLLATNDSHYVLESEADAHDSLLCIGVGKNKDDPNRFKFNGAGYYLKTSDEMRSLFRELPQACDNTLLVAEMVDPYDEVFTYVDRMPQFDVPAGETQESYLRQQVEIGLKKRYGDPIPQNVIERYETEMKVIGPMGFSSYFLIVSDICRQARDTGVPVGPGRGSATGSIVAYATRITELDPLEHELLFERFLNPDRISPPDVDLDFDDRQRDKMVKYVTEKYGAEYTSQVNTFGTIKAKAAVKDANRILGYPFSMGDRITKAMPPDVMGKGVPLGDLFDKNHARYAEGGEIRTLIETDPEVKRIYNTGLGIEGLIRGTGVHAAAVILSSAPLLDLVPMHKRTSDGTLLTGFSYPQCEEMGLMKMDFLGLRNLGIIDHAIKIIETNTGVKLDTLTMPLDDEKTYKLLARGETLGVFQLDGGPMRSLLKLMEPTRFEDIAAVLALYRPGPMAANAHTNYALRKTGKQEVVPIHPDLEEVLEPILGNTFHLLVYQEQIMATARAVAGYTLGQADLLRRAMGKKKKEILEKEFVTFETGMKANGYRDEAIKALWDVMLPFAGYAFNKSHTAGYGLVAYWTAYLKANYPAEYAAALLTSVDDSKDKAAIYLADARSIGIKVLQPDINESVSDFTAVGENVRFGLRAIRNVGDNVIEAIVAARTEKGAFTSFSDFLDKIDLPACNKRAIDSLIRGGAFDSLGHTRKGLVKVAEAAVDAVMGVKRAAGIGQDDLFGTLDTGPDETFGLQLDIDESEWGRKELLAIERDMLGLYVSSHPLDGTERILARERDLSIAELLNLDGPPQGNVTLSGLVTMVERRVSAKSGNPWAKLMVEDKDAAIEVSFFGQSWMAIAPEVTEDLVVSVTGIIQDREGAFSMMGREMKILDVSTVSGGTAPIILSIPTHRVVPDLTEKMRQILTNHPGDTPVHLCLRSHNRRETVMELPNYSVAISGALMGELKALLGSTAVTL
ncbi:DNA polymerase III subunit alpha [Kineosporia mesophila]|uniref:DNA polymerase III subunit alpha n=1 Tax=Kineosporia mesophila TaxID=566012 RepID=A0ABP6ZWL6_9ACTN|nr:DNA polymerase III subunit alpha [Kineosporia mesophila]